MKLLAILAALIFSLTGASQDIARFSTLLKNKDIKALTEYVDSLGARNLFFIPGWVTQREIVAGYEERKTQLVVLRREARGRPENYNIELLTRGGYIFYYKLTERKFKDNLNENNDSLVSYDVVLDSFRDATVYNAFENAFFRAYGINMDPAEMFASNIVFGDMCGYAGSAPEYREKLDLLLQKRDAKTIFSWLRSANTEKQLYGLQGAYALQQMGYDIPPQDAQVIKLIRKKKGFAYTCGGCIFSHDPIQNVIAEIDQLKGKYPLVKKEAAVGGVGYKVVVLILVMTAVIFYIGRRVKKKITDA